MLSLDTAVHVEAAETVRVERIETTPYAFYRLRFRSRTAEQEYWAVFPFETDGRLVMEGDAVTRPGKEK